MFWGTLGLASLATTAFLACFWEDALVVVADQWIVDEPFAEADAVFVLAGSANNRALQAARYYNTGRVPLVLHAKSRLRQSDRLGLTRPDFRLMLRLVRFAGVPEESVLAVGDNCTSTYEEAIALRAWTRTNSITTIAVPTEDFHTRRVRWTFSKVFAEEDITVYVRSIPNSYYEHDEWWRSEYGLITFQNEFVKYCYYRWRF
ncbi:MAG: YdcF family protein [Limisphaerales bacterium]